MNYTPIRLVHVTGLETISAALQGIPNDLKSEILGTAVERGADIMVVAAKRFAKRSEGTGLLRNSIKRIVKRNKNEGRAVAIVGPVRARGASLKRIRAKNQDYTPATRYAHLVEFGHNIAKGGSLRAQYNLVKTGTGKFTKNGKEIKRWKRGTVKVAPKGTVGGWVKAKPFMRPAFVTTRAAVGAALISGISEGIEKSRAKRIKEGSHAA